MELTVNDLRHVHEAVYPARTSWYNIGLQLDVPVDTLDCIEGEKGDDGDHLRNMLKRWLRQGGATWGALADALKSPTVGEHQLAKKLDIRARGQMNKLQSKSIQSASILSTQDAIVNCSSRIEQLEEMYRTLVTTTQEVVRRKAPSIEEFRTAITLLPMSVKREQQQYLQHHLEYIYQAKSIDEIFGYLNLQVWNYLNFGLLECIVAEYGDRTTKEMMEEYRASVQSFRKDTPLCVFLDAQPEGECPEISPSLRNHLQEVRFQYHSLSSYSLLEEIECIRLKVARELALPDFAVALTRILFGSVSIVWTLPSSLTAILEDKIENESFQFIQWADIVEVAIAGTRIYQSAHGSARKRPPLQLPLKTPSMPASKSLEELLRSVSEKTLEKPCSDEHIIEIAREIAKWQSIAPYLGLTRADEENILLSNDVAQQREMLRTWKQKFGSKATYGSLAEALYKTESVDLVEKVSKLLTEEPAATLDP